jgi:uncharacterized protein (TIGR00369 family)
MSGFSEVVGIERVETEDGGALLRLEANEQVLNPYGTVHGGAIATLVDSAMGAAVATTTDEGPVTIEMKISYLEPARPGTLEATASVRRRGSRITIVEAEVTQNGDVVALGTGTFTTVG